MRELVKSAMTRADIDMEHSSNEHFDHFPSVETAQSSASTLSSSAVSSPSSTPIGVSFTAATKGIVLALGAISCITIAYFVHSNITSKDNTAQTLSEQSTSLQPIPEQRLDLQKESITEIPDKHLQSPMSEDDTPQRRLIPRSTNSSEANNLPQTAHHQTSLHTESPSTKTALENLMLSSAAIPDSLLPTDFRGLTIPPSLAKALVERRLQAALAISDSIVNSAQTAYHYALRGHVQKLLNNSQAAIDDYEESLAIEPKASLFFARGLLLLDNHKPQDAWKDFTAALNINPRDKEALYSRAIAAYSLKRFEEACDDWFKAAQAGHPLADSMMSIKCREYFPNNAYSTILPENLLPRFQAKSVANSKESNSANDEKKYLSDILNKMAEVQRILNTEHVPTNINKIRLDTGSLRQLSAECGTDAALNRRGVGLICSIHYLYRFAYEQQDGILMVYINNLHKHIVALALQNSGNQRFPNANNDPTLRDDGVNYDQMIAKELQNGGSTQKVQELQSKKMRQTMVRNINQLQNEQAPKQPRLHNHEALRIIEQAIGYFRDEYKNVTDTTNTSSTSQD